eukprot:TRINITY_DN2434_c0_g1_i8.p1 TRINITY_DN2434_c0_g1~~TRINITY_DN2434_c0_g1_i8.p1  ORF type:complete len:198 (+),score=18.66 TRINITY_DN2434_c0_g1_i8:6-599(+)
MLDNKHENFEKKMEKREFKYKNDLSYEQRRAKADDYFCKVSNSVPVIFERHPLSKLELANHYHKFSIKRTEEVESVILQLEKRLEIPKGIHLQLNTGNMELLQPNTTIDEIYKKNKDEDRFLYLYFSEDFTDSELFDLKFIGQEVNEKWEALVSDILSYSKQDLVPIVLRRHTKSSGKLPPDLYAYCNDCFIIKIDV